MANVKFAYGTKTSVSTSTSGFDDGCIYFGTSAKKIWLRQGSSVYTFDGNNTNNIPGYTTSGSATSKNYGWCSIQNLPHYSSNQGVSTSITGATSWYTWIGQNVISSRTLAYDSYNYYSFDYAMGLTKSLPPLESAKEIILAINPYYIATVLNDGTGLSPANSAFSFYPDECIVHCYRTVNFPYPAASPDDYQYDSNGGMFKGKFNVVMGSLSTSSSYGAATTFGTVDLELCINGTNAVWASVRAMEVKGASEKFSSCSRSGYSADHGAYMEYTSFYPNIERHIYPIAIRYI